MPLLYIRAIAPYRPGTNATDVIINQVHFNRNALDHYNYTLYSNGTLSNGSDCYLAFQRFQPSMMFPSNGSFVNGSSCYSPIHGVGQHAAIGMGFALAFVISVLFSLAGLRKHGRLHLPLDKRWNPAGRRWKWYWLMALAVSGTVGSFMSIDVDRDHVQHSPLVIQSVFYTFLTPFMLAAVWEAVRHWGSWQERQVYNRDQFAFTKKSTRAQQELALPLFFYLFAFITFFLAVPRRWDPIQLQRSPQQQEAQAKPFATDARFKAAGCMGLVAAMVICYSLEHSIYRYIPGPPGTRSDTRTRALRRALCGLQGAPSQFLVAISLVLVKVGYDIAAAFDFSISPLRHGVNPGWLYGLGYTPVLLLVVLFDVCGLCETNEDKMLVFQRAEIENAFAGDVGFGRTKTPSRAAYTYTWLGRLSGRRRRGHERERGLSAEEYDYYRSVEMSTLTSPRTPAVVVVDDDDDDDDDDDEDHWKDGHVQVTTTATASIGTDGQSQPSDSGHPNPFADDRSTSGRSSSSTDDSMQFVRDVLRSLDETETWGGWEDPSTRLAIIDD